MAVSYSYSSREEKDNKENNDIENQDNLNDTKKDTKKDTKNPIQKNRLDVLKKRKEKLPDDGTPTRKLRVAFLDWRIENKSPKQIESGNLKKNDISKPDEKEEKKIEKINSPKTEESKPEVLSQEDESIKEKSTSAEINEPKDDDPQSDLQESLNPKEEVQNDSELLDEKD